MRALQGNLVWVDIPSQGSLRDKKFVYILQNVQAARESENVEVNTNEIAGVEAILS